VNIPPGERRGTDDIIMVPSFIKELVDAHDAVKSDKAPNLTIGQWLRAQPPAVQRTERIRVLQKMGLAMLIGAWGQQ
jgi:hypothetical protein